MSTDADQAQSKRRLSDDESRLLARGPAAWASGRDVGAAAREAGLGKDQVMRALEDLSLIPST